MGHPVNVNGMAVTYTTAGRLATLTYAPGKTVTYAYDNAGQPISMTDPRNNQTRYEYDLAGRLRSIF